MEKIRYLTVAEAKEMLEKESEIRGALSHEQGFALQHATTLVRIPGKRARAIVEELLEIEGVTEPIAVSLVDIVPTHVDDVKAVFHKERYDPPEESLEKILKVFQENF